MTDRSTIAQRVRRLLAAIPANVTVLAAAKTRSTDEIRAVVAAGVRLVGQNYVQEARRAVDGLGRDAAEWHLIGPLQRNKVKVAVQLFDAIQTVDSIRLAEAIDRECAKLGRVMPVLVEINSAREPQKAGVVPEEAIDMIRKIAGLPSVRIDGLMTMGPLVEDPEEIRPCFAEVKRLFDEIAALRIPNVRMRVLSMGMSDSYEVAIDAGATMVRLGTVLFGPRGS
jgi:pyridoxal phosphate enzyme (YggS family)